MVLNIITIIALFVGPIAAVLISIWLQDRKQNYDAKNRLFITLMAHRKALPSPPDLINALNLIDVLFAKHPTVVRLWHDYYDLLCQTPVIWTTAQHKYLDMLAEIARVLGYESLSQTDIDKFYSPQSQADLVQLQLKIAQDLSRVLENTEHLLVEKKSDKEETP